VFDYSIPRLALRLPQHKLPWRGFCIRAIAFSGAYVSTLAVIPARIGATRLPSKPLRLLGGKPLILRVWERVSAMRFADRVVVATDSDEVMLVCREAGADVALTRRDHPSGTDRVAEVMGMPGNEGVRVIVNVQGDEPSIPAEAVEGAALLVQSGKFDVGTAAATGDPEILGDPNVVKVVVGDDGRALYFSRAPIPFLRERGDQSALVPLVRRHLGVYAYSRAALETWVRLPVHPLEAVERLEQLRPLAAGISIGVATIGTVSSGGIDTEQDLALANDLWTDNNQ
jgi:3-deoxy-manno-octulosonate cytidylyltransferase (CMP-KDO synthetase)